MFNKLREDEYFFTLVGQSLRLSCLVLERNCKAFPVESGLQQRRLLIALAVEMKQKTFETTKERE